MVSMSLKGNSGRRLARQILMKKLTVIIVAFVTCWVTLRLSGFIGDDEEWERYDGEGGFQRLKQRLKNVGSKLRKGPDGTRYIKVDLRNDKESLDKILYSDVHLVNLYVSKASQDGTGVLAEFCTIDFSAHKTSPSEVPMFRHLVQRSEGCQELRYRVKLSQIASMARAFDLYAERQPDPIDVAVLDMPGVVFHESRCGSTLVANSLIAMNPEQHRVYSESAPPIQAIRGICGEDYTTCSMDLAVKLLQDTVYLMRRSADVANEERVFFKFQSISTRNIAVFQKAFPETPFIFVYREPVEVLMSQMQFGAKSANCVRPKRGPQGELMTHILEQHDFSSPKQTSNEDYCAAHLASITESALAAINRAPELGMAVNYADLPKLLHEEIFPKHFGLSVGPKEVARIERICSVYSKGTGNRAGEFHEDAEEKEKNATPEIRKAAAKFLQKSFDQLELHKTVPIRTREVMTR